MSAGHGALPLFVAGEPWLYTVARCTLVPLACLYCRLDVEGREHVPSSGAALLLADHPSDLDPLLVALPLVRTVHFLASADHYQRPFVGWCMRRLATVSVDLDGVTPHALDEAARLLEAGELVAAFPEPNERRPGSGQGSPGAAAPPLGAAALTSLAQACAVPVVRVAIRGTAELQWGRWRHELPGAWRRRPGVRIAFAPPVLAARRPDAAPVMRTSLS